MTTSTVAPVREGFHTITPYLVVPNAPELIDFMKRTFGAQELLAQSTPGGGFHAEVRIGDSMLMIGSGESVRGHERIGAFHVFVPDCDAVYNRAIAAGGISMGEPADRPYGERSGSVKDAAGNYWHIATRLPGSEPIEGTGTVVPYLHPAKARPFIDFVKRAFDARELAVYEQGGRVMHAAVRIGDAVVEMGESPRLPTKRILSVRRGLRRGVPARDRSRRDVALAAGRPALRRPHGGDRGSLRLPVVPGHPHHACQERRWLAHSARDSRYNT